MKWLAIVGTTMVLSCAPLPHLPPPPSDPPLRVHQEANMVREAVNIPATRSQCDFLGIVEASGKEREGRDKYRDAILQVRSRVAELGGNIFVVIYYPGYSFGLRRERADFFQAEAYLCSSLKAEDADLPGR